MKSQGNQITKLKVKEVLLDHEIEGDTPWPEPEKPVMPEVSESTEEDGGITIEWDMTNKDEDNDSDQPKLF